MEELRGVALAYYKSGTDEERRLFDKFFKSMDQDGNGKVNFREFSDFMSQGHQSMCSRDFFDELDRDGNRSLDFKEVLTLYYIIKSGRPICRQCKRIIPREYFTCMKCFKSKTFPYSICLECFRNKKGKYEPGHGLEQFVDNFALLESMRKSALKKEEDEPSPSRSQRIVSNRRNNSQNTSSNAMVVFNANNPAERREGWRTALGILETGLQLASVVTYCTIM